MLGRYAQNGSNTTEAVYGDSVDHDAAELTTPLVHVGRQPIYDRTGDVIAYELLFRDAADATRATERSAEATGRVIVSAFTEFGLDQLVGARACFINVTREFLIGEFPIPFDPNQSVLEVVETMQVDVAVVAGVRKLVDEGYTIALDYFLVGTHERLLEFATYVKIDLLDVDAAVVADAVERCRAFPHIELIAERLETEDDLQRAMELGFTYFQGHVLGHPHVVSTPTLSPARVSRMQLLVELTATEVDFDEVVRLVGRDPALTFRLLQATNSAASGLTSRVSSVHEAATLLGLDKVRQWVTLMLLSELSTAGEDQLSTTMTRARACGATAQQIGRPPDAAFTAGLLCGVAELTSQPPAEMAGKLPLSPELVAALVERSGPLGEIVTAVREYERGRPAALAAMLTPEDAVRTYLEALGWSTGVLRSVTPAQAASER
jgi:c-di-GMP-related signal transduction protein